MKILQINKLYSPHIGGVETTVQNISEKLLQKNIQVDVLVCQLQGKRTIEIINNIKVYKASSWGKYLGLPLSLDFFIIFRKIIKDYDTIIIHHPFPLAFLLIPFIKNKKIYIIYHSDIVKQKITKIPFLPFINLGLKKANKIFVGGKNIINYSPVLNSYKDKCVIIPFGLDINKYKINTEIITKAEIIKKKYSSPLLLAVGRLVVYKGYKYLISAMKNIPNNLIIIGEGPQEKELKKLIYRYKLTDRISIIPPVSNLAPYYLASDIFIFPSCSHNEAFGLVQLEAMYYTTPIINTRLHTAVEEVSLDGITGLTIPPKNIIAIDKAIKYLLQHPEEREQMGHQAHLRVINKYNIDIFINHLIENL